MQKKILILGAGLCCLFEMGMAKEFTLKLGTGWSWVEGGDLNESIAGWRRYYQDRQSPVFSATYTLKEMHSFPEAEAELAYHLSSRWSVGVQAGWQRQQRGGEISTRLKRGETIPLLPAGTTSIDLEESSSKKASFTLEGIPVTITINYSIPLGEKFWLDLGVGGGIAWSKLRYGEDYKYSFNYTEETLAAGTSFQYVERFSSAGEYTEETRSRGLCLSSRLGLHFKLSPSLFLMAELFGRWVDLKNWEGRSAESFEWRQTWGPWGAYSERGESKKSTSGRLWRVDVRSSETDGSYPRLVFSGGKPASSAYVAVKPARLNLSGTGLRIGLAFGFGKRE